MTQTPTCPPSIYVFRALGAIALAFLLVMTALGAAQGYSPVVIVSPEPSPLPFPLVTPTPTPPAVKEQIKAGFKVYSQKHWNGRKIRAQQDDLLDVLAEATEKHPFFKENPYLLPAMTIAESSGCMHITYENNCINWGIKIDEWNAKASTMSMSQVLEHTVNRLSTSKIYKRHMETNDVAGFLSTYEPANKDYVHNVTRAVKNFWEGGEE